MLQEFLDQLLYEGRITVDPPTHLTSSDLEEATTALARFEVSWRLGLAFEPPRFDPEAALGAAVRFARAAQAVVFRDVALADLDTLKDPIAMPDPRDPAAHYAVDLTFRFLPDLIRFARSAAEGDPLVDRLRDWAVTWPLSSIGLAGLDPEAIGRNLGPIRDQPTLRQLYVDRIVHAQDTGRLDDPAIRDVVRSALGLQTHLAPELARALDDLDTPSPLDESAA